jgi:RNA polymerase sigma factor (sigma-70 family)
MSKHAATINADIAALLPRLRRFARTITAHRDDGDDLVQAAVERALAGQPPWEAGARLDGAMFRIMKNTWMNEVRNRIRRESGEAAGEGDTAAGALQQAMRRLSEDQRIVIGLVLADGLSYQHAADVLEIPVGTLSGRLARARVALQGVLSDQARTVA